MTIPNVPMPSVGHKSLSPHSQVLELAIAADVRAAISAEALKAADLLGTTIEEEPHLMAEAGAEILLEELPEEAVAGLRQLATPSNTCLVTLRGVADFKAPETPVTGLADNTALSVQDIVLAGAMHIAGTRPCAFAFENQGRIARNVVANPEQRGKASSHGYDVELFWHQDNCGQPFENETLETCALPPMPRQLAFFAIRNEERVPTRILLVDDALSLLMPETIDILKQPLYRIGAPDSIFADGNGGECVTNAPILHDEKGELFMRYDPFLVSTKDPAAMLAHARLMIALSEATPKARDVTLNAGDVMIFKNYRLLHMRVAFEPKEARKSRWLRRFYGSAIVM